MFLPLTLGYKFHPLFTPEQGFVHCAAVPAPCLPHAGEGGWGSDRGQGDALLPSQLHMTPGPLGGRQPQHLEAIFLSSALCLLSQN